MVFYTAVHFRYRAELEFGNRLIVVGSDSKLGNWNTKYAHELAVSDIAEDIWNSYTPVHLPLKQVVEYRYAVLDDRGDFLRWCDSSLRRLEPTGNEMLVEDDEGYYRNKCSKYTFKDKDTEGVQSTGLRSYERSPNAHLRIAQDLGTCDLDSNDMVYYVSSRLPIQIFRQSDGTFGIRDSNTPLTSMMWELRNRYNNRMRFIGACSITTESDSDSKNDFNTNTKYAEYFEDKTSSGSRAFKRGDSVDRGTKRHDLLNMENTNSEDGQYIVEFTEEEQEEIRKLLLSYDCIPVFIPKGELKKSLKFCQIYMWNLFYNIGLWDIVEQKEFNWDLWQSFLKVNNYYASVVAQCISDNDYIWVHDYKLLMVPHFITRKTRTANIGLFMHALFPSCSLFACLAVREEILRSMLCADLIGFHYFEFARQFLTSCRRLLGLEFNFSVGGVLRIEYNGRQVMVRMSHAHIQPDMLMKKIADNTRIPELVEDIKKKWPNRFIIASVDRDTRLSGLVLKFKAFRRFLRAYPNARGKVLLVQHACTMDTLWEGNVDIFIKLRELVHAINADFQTTHIIFNCNITTEQKYALFMAADCFMDTAIRGGINLAAFEYIFCRKGMAATAIVSEFTGFSKTLLSAVRVNPWHMESVMDALDTVMSRSLEDSVESCRRDVDYLMSYDAITWVEDFVKELFYARKKDDMIHLTWGFGRTYKTYSVSSNFQLLDPEYVLKYFENSKRRLLFLDCEGTLSPNLSDARVRSTSEMKRQIKLHSAPLEINLESLRILASDKRNVIVLISCRVKKIMESWFGEFDNVGMCAEHGYDIKLPAVSGNEWYCTHEVVSESWKDAATQILEQYAKRTPGSYLDIDGSAVSFQYHNSDPEFGTIQANELYPVLCEVMARFPVEVHRGKGRVEVKLKGINKGNTFLNVVKKYSVLFGDFDFILCIGDDRSDEEMFKALNTLCNRVSNKDGTSDNLIDESKIDEQLDNYISCTVGKRPSKAKFYLNDYLEVAELLSYLAKR